MNLICPVCGEALLREPHRYVCANRHAFDRARSGYVNLLRRQTHRQRGDDAAMVRARRDFLDTGLYAPLLEAVAEAAGEPETVADIGCGEGWYACSLLKALRAAGSNAALAGFDISTEALRYAAARAARESLAEYTDWAAASVSHIPLADRSCGCILNLFAPCEPSEFLRILQPDGILIRAIPLERHLWELKEAVYDAPYENRPVREAPAGFRLCDFREIETRITVSGTALENLFAMTPYKRKTAASDAEKLLGIDSLTVQLAFGLLVCQPES